MIERNSLYHVPYYSKAAFTGSYLGMHYKLQKIKGSESSEDSLCATVWPGPFCFDATPEEQKTSASFEFSNEGISAACDWLNEQYTKNEATYKAVHI